MSTLPSLLGRQREHRSVACGGRQCEVHGAASGGNGTHGAHGEDSGVAAGDLDPRKRVSSNTWGFPWTRWRYSWENHGRRKFRSQTGQILKSRGGKSQRREEKRRRKKIKKEKVSEERRSRCAKRKVTKHCVFPMICGSGGSKSRFAKAVGAEPAGQMRDEKLHAIVARSTCRSQNAQNTSLSEQFLKLRCRKSARCCGAKHISKVNTLKTPGVPSTFGRSDVVLRGRRRGLRTSSKVSKTEGFVAFLKTMAGMGHLKRICKDAFSVAGAVQETCSSELLGGPGADFLRGVAFWSIRSSVLGT